jgi:hypothetical protein
VCAHLHNRNPSGGGGGVGIGGAGGIGPLGSGSGGGGAGGIGPLGSGGGVCALIFIIGTPRVVCVSLTQYKYTSAGGKVKQKTESFRTFLL